MNEYISVSEFAKIAGVSRQAIQQRLTTSLAEFVKADSKGIKLLNIKGLELFGVALTRLLTSLKARLSKAQSKTKKTYYTRHYHRLSRALIRQ